MKVQPREVKCLHSNSRHPCVPLQILPGLFSPVPSCAEPFGAGLLPLLRDCCILRVHISYLSPSFVRQCHAACLFANIRIKNLFSKYSACFLVYSCSPVFFAAGRYLSSSGNTSSNPFESEQQSGLPLSMLG